MLICTSDGKFQKSTCNMKARIDSLLYGRNFSQFTIFPYTLDQLFRFSIFSILCLPSTLQQYSQ